MTKTCASVLVVVLLGLSNLALAEVHYYSGSACLPNRSITDLYRGGYQFGNCSGNGGACSSTATVQNVVCPVTSMTSVTNVSTVQVAIYYQDKDNTQSVSCFWEGQNYNGSYYTSGNKYSCSTSGGCTSPNVSYITSGAPNALVWNNPLNGGSTISDLGGGWGAYCYLPGYGSEIDGFAAVQSP